MADCTSAEGVHTSVDGIWTSTETPCSSVDFVFRTIAALLWRVSALEKSIKLRLQGMVGRDFFRTVSTLSLLLLGLVYFRLTILLRHYTCTVVRIVCPFMDIYMYMFLRTYTTCTL